MRAKCGRSTGQHSGSEGSGSYRVARRAAAVAEAVLQRGRASREVESDISPPLSTFGRNWMKHAVPHLLLGTVVSLQLVIVSVPLQGRGRGVYNDEKVHTGHSYRDRDTKRHKSSSTHRNHSESCSMPLW